MGSSCEGQGVESMVDLLSGDPYEIQLGNAPWLPPRSALALARFQVRAEE